MLKKLEIEARTIAEEHLASQDLRGFNYKFLKVSYNEKKPDNYAVVFNVYSPENTLIDGPAIFVVNIKTKEVSSL